MEAIFLFTVYIVGVLALYCIGWLVFKKTEFEIDYTNYLNVGEKVVFKDLDEEFIIMAKTYRYAFLLSYDGLEPKNYTIVDMMKHEKATIFIDFQLPKKPTTDKCLKVLKKIHSGEYSLNENNKSPLNVKWLK